MNDMFHKLKKKKREKRKYIFEAIYFFNFFSVLRREKKGIEKPLQM